MTTATGGRGGRRRTAAAAIVVAVLVVGGIALLWPRASGGTAGEVHHIDAAATAPTEGPTTPETTGESRIVTPDVGTVGSAPQTSLSEAAGSTDPVRDGVAALGEARDAVDPADVIASGTTLGGCHDAYGSAGQCLPVIPPSLAQHAADMAAAGLDPSTMPHSWSCREVRLSFPGGVSVREPGVDPDALDDDHDGTACEPDD